MNLRRIIASCILLAVMNGAASADNAGPANPLGTFDFDFSRLGASKAAQLQAVREMGYTGITMNLTVPSQFAHFDRYAESLPESGLRFYAGYVVLTLKDDNTESFDHLDRVIRRLQSVDGRLWVILRKTELERGRIVETIREIADRAAALGVELVLYPHDNCQIESAEDALKYIDEAGHDNLFVSLHLCHEIRAGNGDRLPEVAQQIRPYLRLPTINGADAAYTDNNEDWSHTIRPLGQGDFDAARLIDALGSIDYEGPVILHTFGLEDQPADHHQRSMAVYRDMVEVAGERPAPAN